MLLILEYKCDYLREAAGTVAIFVLSTINVLRSSRAPTDLVKSGRKTAVREKSGYFIFLLSQGFKKVHCH